MSTLGQPELADCILVVGPEEKEIYASRAILAKECPYFKTMFTSRMAEAKMADDLTGESNKIYFPEEDVAIFSLLLRLLYGEIDGLPADTTPATFAAVAAKADMWLLTSGPVFDACLGLLKSKLRTPAFVPLLLAYRGANDEREIPGLIHRAMSKWAESKEHLSDLLTPEFRDKCDITDLLAVARGFCEDDGRSKEAMQFVRDFMIPAVRRIKKIENKESLGPVDKALAKPLFSWDTKTRVTLNAGQVMRLRFLGIGEVTAIEFPPCAKLWWESDDDEYANPEEEDTPDPDFGCTARLIMQVDLGSWVYFQSLGGESIRDEEDIPGQFVCFVVCRRKNFVKLYNNIASEPDETPVISFHTCAQRFHCQTLLYSYMLLNASKRDISFDGGITPHIYGMLSNKEFWGYLDPKLTATKLVATAGKALCAREHDPIPRVAREFFVAMPWQHISVTNLMRCIEAPAALTGMQKHDWAHIITALMDPGHRWTTPHLNFTGNSHNLVDPLKLARTLAGALNDKATELRDALKKEAKSNSSSSAVPMEVVQNNGKEEKTQKKEKKKKKKPEIERLMEEALEKRKKKTGREFLEGHTEDAFPLGGLLPTNKKKRKADSQETSANSSSSKRARV